MASIKSWVDDYDAVEKGVEDLRLMPEFVEAGLATEAEMDEHYRATMERIEALELRNMLRGEEDKMGAIMDINAARAAPRLSTGRRCFCACTPAGATRADTNTA